MSSAVAMPARVAGFRLDPRTKLLAAIVVSAVLLSPSQADGQLGTTARWVLIALPAALFIASGHARAALSYGATFLILAGTPELVWHVAHWDNPLLGTLVAWLGGMSLITPGMTCCWYALRTTSASEFIAAMQRMHCPDTLTIPAAVAFRFLPTIAEEYHEIRTAMRMRGISGLRNPIAMLEYRFVPLLVSVVSIGNELARSAVTRALGSGRRRTSVCRIGLHVADYLVFLVLAGCVAAVIVGRIRPA